MWSVRINLPQPRLQVDAFKEGNVARYFNHSCDPNMEIRSVFRDCIDARLPRLAFFTLRRIAKGKHSPIGSEYMDIDINRRRNDIRLHPGKVERFSDRIERFG